MGRGNTTLARVEGNRILDQAMSLCHVDLILVTVSRRGPPEACNLAFIRSV